MKYLKVYENFMDSMNSNIAADEESDMMKNDEIYSDEETEGIEESQFGAEEILARWEEAFSDKEPTTQEKYDFYHELRNEGFDGFLIFDTLGSKMDKEEDEYSFDEVQNESNEEECIGCKCSPCKCNEEKEEDQEEVLDEDCSSCNCSPCKCK